MPLFDYHCPACGADFERLVRSDTVVACPSCGATQVERQVSRIAPAGTSAAILAAGRRAAAKEGHFSNYSKAERAKAMK